MKKIALMVLVAVVAASPAMAAKKAKKMQTAAVMSTTPANSNEASWHLVKDAFPSMLPSWAIPIYLNAQAQK